MQSNKIVSNDNQVLLQSSYGKIEWTFWPIVDAPLGQETIKTTHLGVQLPQPKAKVMLYGVTWESTCLGAIFLWSHMSEEMHFTMKSDLLMPAHDRLGVGWLEWFQQAGTPSCLAKKARDWLDDDFQHWIVWLTDVVVWSRLPDLDTLVASSGFIQWKSEAKLAEALTAS